MEELIFDEEKETEKRRGGGAEVFVANTQHTHLFHASMTQWINNNNVCLLLVVKCFITFHSRVL